MKIPKPCLSVRLSICLYSEKRNYPGFVNISRTLVIDTSMERSSRVIQHGNPKIKKKLKSSKFEFWLVTKSWNHLSFVNISPTLVIDASMERSSRVLQHRNPKIWICFQKSLKLNFDLYFDLCWIAEITLASSISVAHWQLIHQWKGLHEYYSMETLKFDFFFQKIKIEFWRMLTSWNHLSFVNISPTLVIDTSMERSSPSTTTCPWKMWIL